jgi:hypothetical protein
MTYDSKELRQHIRQEGKKIERAPLRELSESQAFKRLENDILRLLHTIDDRVYFANEVEKLTARYGLRIGLEQRANALCLYDQYQTQKTTFSP